MYHAPTITSSYHTYLHSSGINTHVLRGTCSSGCMREQEDIMWLYMNPCLPGRTLTWITRPVFAAANTITMPTHINLSITHNFLSSFRIASLPNNTHNLFVFYHLWKRSSSPSSKLINDVLIYATRWVIVSSSVARQQTTGSYQPWTGLQITSFAFELKHAAMWLNCKCWNQLKWTTEIHDCQARLSHITVALTTLP